MTVFHYMYFQFEPSLGGCGDLASPSGVQYLLPPALPVTQYGRKRKHFIALYKNPPKSSIYYIEIPQGHSSQIFCKQLGA